MDMDRDQDRETKTDDEVYFKVAFTKTHLSFTTSRPIPAAFGPRFFSFWASGPLGRVHLAKIP